MRPTDLIGQSIDRYHIIQIIGEGGMAVVYKAFDKRLESEVAFKLLRTEMLTVESQKTVLDRFEFEAKALAKLNHPNIVSVIDYGDYQGTPWLVMKYMEGGTVKQFIGNVVPPPEAARLLAPIASALAYAHSRDIVHRDVKPSNILISEAGFPMLSDFGIAKIVAKQDFKLTKMGISIGTPEYMSPEQAKGRVTKLSDQYSLGLVFYELLTGVKPYAADTPVALVLKKITEPLIRPSEVQAGIPAAVEQVVFKALSREPEDRYPSMQAFYEALRKIANIDDDNREKTISGYHGSTRTITTTQPVDCSWIRPKDRMPTMFIPAGKAVLGRDDAPDASPMHIVALDSFLIDKHPVTNRMYSQFLNEVGNQEEGGSKWYDDTSKNARLKWSGTCWLVMRNYSEHPVVSVSWYGAAAYCRWIGGRLPSEAEWEKAARGLDDRIYPWGNDPPSYEHANYKGFGVNTSPVGKFPKGASGFGVLDRAGNVWEWVGDWYGRDYYAHSLLINPRGPENGEKKVMRGGSWYNLDRHLKVSYRSYSDPGTQTTNLGFRCVTDPEMKTIVD